MNRLFIGSPDKTNFLLQCIAEDFSRGFTLIDPTGHLARASANALPVKCTQRALYLDPSDMDHPVGLNVLENVPPDQRQILTENICSYFEAMWPNGWGAQSNYILANCLRLLLDTPGETILGILKLLTHKSHRHECLLNCTDPVVRSNWEIINGWDTRQEQAAIAPLLNKIGTLLMSPTIRNIVGQKHSTFSLTRNNIIIADLDRAKIGDLTARLLGGLLISRSSGHVYINDLAFFASDHFASFLAQNRFTVSLQFLDEIPMRLRQAVLSIDDKMVLKTNPEDAKLLAFYLGLMNPRPLTELSPGEAMTPAGSFIPEPIRSLKRLKALRKCSTARHSRPRKLVERTVATYFSRA